MNCSTPLNIAPGVYGWLVLLCTVLWAAVFFRRAFFPGLLTAGALLWYLLRHHAEKLQPELQDILQTGPHGLRIVPASSGLKQMVELTVEQHAGLIRAFSTLKEDIDYFIVDTAAGISDMVLSFCRAAQDVLMVVCNEPTSVADAYAQMKVLSRDYGVKKFKIIGNQLHSLDEGKLMYQKLVAVTERFIDATLELVACIPVDMNMRKAIRQRSCVVDLFPTSPAARAFKTLANRITTWPIPDIAGGHLEFFVENLISADKKN